MSDTIYTIGKISPHFASLRSQWERLIDLPEEVPDASKSKKAATAFDDVLREIVDTRMKLLGGIDQREAEHDEAVRAAGAELKRIPPTPDFAAERKGVQGRIDVLTAEAHQAKRALLDAIEADNETQGKRDAENLPTLYAEAVSALEHARSAYVRAYQARERAIMATPVGDVRIRRLPGAEHFDHMKDLEKAEKWIKSVEDVFVTFAEAGALKPSGEVREQMARAGGKYKADLHRIELGEDFRYTRHTVGYDAREEALHFDDLTVHGGGTARSQASSGGVDVSDLHRYFE